MGGGREGEGGGFIFLEITKLRGRGFPDMLSLMDLRKGQIIKKEALGARLGFKGKWK